MGGVALKEGAEASRELACTKQKPVVYGGGVEFLSAVSCDYLECPFLGSGSLGGVEDGKKADLELPAEGSPLVLVQGLPGDQGFQSSRPRWAEPSTPWSTTKKQVIVATNIREGYKPGESGEQESRPGTFLAWVRRRV